MVVGEIGVDVVPETTSVVVSTLFDPEKPSVVVSTFVDPETPSVVVSAFTVVVTSIFSNVVVYDNSVVVAIMVEGISEILFETLAVIEGDNSVVVAIVGISEIFFEALAVVVKPSTPFFSFLKAVNGFFFTFLRIFFLPILGRIPFV